MQDLRLKSVVAAAARLFIRQSYAKTRIQHIAREASVAVGSVYNLYQNKEAILYYVLESVILPAQDAGSEADTLPLPERPQQGLEEPLRQGFGNAVSAFVQKAQAPESYPYTQMLSDVFDLTARYAALGMLLEVNRGECGGLFRVYLACRAQMFEAVQHCMTIYAKAGQVRESSAISPEKSARFLVESIAWWGMRVQFQSFEEAQSLTLVERKILALDALGNAYGMAPG